MNNRWKPMAMNVETRKKANEISDKLKRLKLMLNEQENNVELKEQLQKTINEIMEPQGEAFVYPVSVIKNTSLSKAVFLNKEQGLTDDDIVVVYKIKTSN